MTKRLVRTSLALMAATSLIAAACGGDDTKFGNTGGGGTGTAGTGAGGEGAGEPGVFEPAAGGVRRLLGVQYSNTVGYLFGTVAADAVIASDLLPTDNPVSGYAAIGAAQTPPGLSFPEFYDLAAEVVAEAIAMRKRVVLPTSPCNVFFQENFPDRCHFYNSLDVTSFVKALRAALDGGMPEPLTESEQELAQL